MFKAFLSSLVLSSCAFAAPWKWPNPIYADVSGPSGSTPQSITIPWSQANQRYQYDSGTWNLTITAASGGFFPVSLLDPPAPMRITDSTSNLLAGFNLTYDHDLIHAAKTFSGSPDADLPPYPWNYPESNVVIRSSGLIPEPSLLSLMAILPLLRRRGA